MSEPFLQTMEKGTKCLIEGSMLEWIYYVRLKTLPDDYFPTFPGKRDIRFTEELTGGSPL